MEFYIQHRVDQICCFYLLWLINAVLYIKFHAQIVQVFILVKRVDHLKHDAKNIKPDIISQLTNEDLKEICTMKHVCSN